MTMQLTTVLLYGHLGKAFGHTHRFAINSVYEALKALKANFKGFEQYMIEHNLPGYKVFTGDEIVPYKELCRSTGKTIKIVPVVAGAASKGPLEIIAGIALIILAPELIGFLAEGTALTAGEITALGYLGMGITAIGWALTLKGIGSLLQPKGPNTAADAPSYGFNGAVNVTSQGNPIPVCYGRLIVGSQVISVGLDTVQLM